MSKITTKIYLALILSLFSSGIANCQIISLGGIFSADNYGLVLDICSKDGHNIERFTISDDHFGYFTGNTNDIGLKFSYTHEYVFRTYDFGEYTGFFHGGAGVFLGYLHDREYNPIDKRALQFKKEMGWAIGISTSMGFCIDFPRGISVDCSFALNPAFHYRVSSYDGSTYLSLYLNGLVRSFLPRIAILYSF